MVLTVHHLRVSQSERIPWLLEELGLPYELVTYRRNKDDNLAPPELKNLPGNHMQSAPVLHDTDGDVTLAESGAIIQYILTKYGDGKLVPAANTKEFSVYLDWLHRCNGSMLTSMTPGLYLDYAGVPADSPVRGRLNRRRDLNLAHAERTLAASKFLAGNDFTAADVMCLTAFNNIRFFVPYSLENYPNIVRYAGDCAKRPAFKAAMQKADPEIANLQPIGIEPPSEDMKWWRK